MLNDTYILPSPIKPSSIHAKRRRRRRRRRRGVVVMIGSFRVRDGNRCGFGSGGFQRQIHEKEKRQQSRASPDQSQDPSIISTNAKRHVCRALC